MIIDKIHACIGVYPRGKTFLSVGIAYRINEINAVGKFFLDKIILGSCQIVGRQQGSFRTGSFISMNTVSKKNNQWGVAERFAVPHFRAFLFDGMQLG
ncbi:hypothetical protein Barb6_03362 [Bacteroidales bacterium Barb6]|nr:hypothetical protein Barb6_03362 [Bacteroidales bacterium Barb6]